MKKKWPDELGLAIENEFLKRLINKVIPHSEASIIAIVTQFLCAFGNVIGLNPFLRVGADIHRPILFVAIVGNSSKARKGSSWAIVRLLFSLVAADWSKDRNITGLSSSEGLIELVRDPREPRDSKDEGDPGVLDKRLFVQESEFTAVLKNFVRTNNKLSETARNMWDGYKLQNVTRINPMNATKPHISIVAHVTESDLSKHLNQNEMANGFGNRIQWYVSKRSKKIPSPIAMDEDYFQEEARHLKDIIDFSSNIKEVKKSDEAEALWQHSYDEISREYPGILGDITARSEAQTLRLALIYALLDKSDVIERRHLESAIDLWRYSLQSCQYIWGSATGDDIADKIYKALKAHPDGLTRTQISKDILKGNTRKESLDQAFAALEQFGLAKYHIESSGSFKNVQIWKAYSLSSLATEFTDLTNQAVCNEPDTQVREVREVRTESIPDDPQLRSLTYDPAEYESYADECMANSDWDDSEEAFDIDPPPFEGGIEDPANDCSDLTIPFEPNNSTEVTRED